MKELLEKYPKAAKVVRQYYLEKLLESLKADLPEEFKEHVRQQGVTDEMVSKLVDKQPRLLFDVFDDNEIYIQTQHHINIAELSTPREYLMFTGYVLGNAVGVFQTRKEAEKVAVEQAFKLLEEKL